MQMPTLFNASTALLLYLYLVCAVVTYAEEVMRNSLRHVAENWLEQCINFDAMFAAHMMPYAVQPNVMTGTAADTVSERVLLLL